MTSAESARDLIAFAAGPSVFGVLAAVIFGAQTLTAPERVRWKGWTLLAGGIGLAAWFALFLAAAAPALYAYWTDRDRTEPVFLLLSANWVVVLVVLIALLAKAKAVCRYLVGCYAPEDRPWPVRVLARWVGRTPPGTPRRGR
ncbi:hypothetical protein [Glycomyces tarimensis]